MLAGAADTCLMGHERTMTFVELGSREHHLAIERILNAVVSTRMVLPLAIFDRLTRWLDGYAGSPEEPHLRSLAAGVRTHQAEPVPLRADAARHHISNSPPPCVPVTSTPTPGAMCQERLEATNPSPGQPATLRERNTLCRSLTARRASAPGNPPGSASR